MIFTIIYAFILKHVMCSISTNLKFRIKKFDNFSNILTADSKGIFYLGIIPLHSRYDTFILNSTTFCSKKIRSEIYISYNSFKIPIQRFNNIKILSIHHAILSKLLLGSTKIRPLRIITGYGYIPNRNVQHSRSYIALQYSLYNDIVAMDRLLCRYYAMILTALSGITCNNAKDGIATSTNLLTVSLLGSLLEVLYDHMRLICIRILPQKAKHILPATFNYLLDSGKKACMLVESTLPLI